MASIKTGWIKVPLKSHSWCNNPTNKMLLIKVQDVDSTSQSVIYIVGSDWMSAAVRQSGSTT